MIIKIKMYPSKVELRGATETYLKNNHPEFLNKFSEYQWTAYFKNNFYKEVSSLFYF